MSIWKAALANGVTIADPAAAAALTQGAAPADLTENGGAIGGTNDGDIPALVDPAGDSGASVIAGIRENATKINLILAQLAKIKNDVAAVRTAVGANKTAIDAIISALETANIIKTS